MRTLRALSAVVLGTAVLGVPAAPAYAKVIFSCTCNDDCAAAGPTDVCVDTPGTGRICCPTSSFCPPSPGAGIPCGGTDAAPPGTDAAVPNTDAAGATDSGNAGSDAASPGTDGAPASDAGPETGRGGCACRVAASDGPPATPVALLAAALLLVRARRGRRKA